MFLASDSCKFFETEITCGPDPDQADCKPFLRRWVRYGGDETNDFWYIRRIENYPSCKVVIYDRWGQRVFNSTGYSNNNPWDGTFLNKPLPAAAYYYVIELNASTSKEADTYYGWVAIIY